MYISEIMTGAPTDERCPLERRMYETLDKLKIPYERVDNDPAASMEECAEVDKVLGTEIRKNVFLCNQKKTTFFLLVMPANKSFDTAAFSKKTGCVSYVLCSAGENAGASWNNARISQCGRSSCR